MTTISFPGLSALENHANALPEEENGNGGMHFGSEFVDLDDRRASCILAQML